MEDKEKLSKVDLVGVGNLLEHLIAKELISCVERDSILRRIARDNDFSEFDISVLAGYKRRKEDVLARRLRRRSPDSTRSNNKSDDNYVSLTELVRAHCETAPGYVIQSWLRSENTLAFLNLWEKENNPNYCEDSYMTLLEKKKAASFTLTPKQWIEQTKAIGIVSKQGKSGGTLAHPMIACEFASWLTPEFKMLLLKLSLSREQLR